MLRHFKIKVEIKSMSLRINNNKLLEKYKTIWTMIEHSKNFKLNALPVCDNRYIKIKIRTYGSSILWS